MSDVDSKRPATLLHPVQLTEGSPYVYLSKLRGRKMCGLKIYHLIMSTDGGFADVWGQFWVRLN